MKDLVLITGISGFIAKQVALSALSQGYAVRGTVRVAGRGEQVREALAANGANTSSLDFAEADLTEDAGWAEATKGCRYVLHVASPFPIEQPADREALVPQARAGTLRVLEAARSAGVERVVITSSMVAMMYRADSPKELLVSEADWTDPEWDQLSAYIVSKTRAERAAWDWAEANEFASRLTVVNPGFVLGPLSDNRFGTSVGVIKMILDGAYPAVPPVSFPVVDVRDLAKLHVAAMSSESVAGRRLIGAGETVSMQEMAQILKRAFPERARKIPTRLLPAFVVRLMARFDRSLRSVTPDLGVTKRANSAYVTDLTGVSFRPAAESIVASARSLVDRGLA